MGNIQDHSPYGDQNFEQQRETMVTQSVARPPSMGRKLGRMIGAGVLKMRNPFVGGAALMVVAAFFVGLIAVSYQGGSETQGNLPVIKADTGSYKTMPETAGGMSVPHQESAIFQAMRDGQTSEPAPVMAQTQMPEGRVVENLLAPMDAQQESTAQASVIEEKMMELTEAVAQKPQAESLNAQAEPAQATQAAAVQPKPKPSERPSSMHAAGSSPETLAFVRSVLDSDDETQKLDKINPAAGTPSKAVKAAPSGSYYVQLGSVTSEAGAQKEWGVLYKNYGAKLPTDDYRVQKADLGARGTYFRIQAGPMSKEAASGACEAIKAQKPGACLVVR